MEIVHSYSALEGLASHLCALVSPEGVVVSQVGDLLHHVAHHLAAHLALDGALQRGELTLGGCEVAADGLAEALSLVLAGAVDEQGVEEDYIAPLHLEVNPWLGLELVVFSDAEVGLIDLPVPVGIPMLVKLALMRVRIQVQPSIFLSGIFERSPSRNDAVGWFHGEVGQVLMEWMP